MVTVKECSKLRALEQTTLDKIELVNSPEQCGTPEEILGIILAPAMDEYGDGSVPGS